VTRTDLERLIEQRQTGGPGLPFADLIHRHPSVAHPDEPLRAVVYRMAETGLTRFPVVERGASGRLVGLVGLFDLLEARRRSLDAERRRDRVLAIPLRPRILTRRRSAPPASQAG
jgi:CIC family chloride channel protein